MADDKQVLLEVKNLTRYFPEGNRSMQSTM